MNSLCNLATQIWIQDQFRPDESSNSTELKCQAKLEAYLRNCRAIRANSPTYLPNIVDWRRLDATIEWWEYDSDEETENSLDLHAEYKEQIDTLKEKESELQQQIERLKTSSAKPTSSSSEVVLRVDNTSKIRFCGNDMDNFSDSNRAKLQSEFKKFREQLNQFSIKHEDRWRCIFPALQKTSLTESNMQMSSKLLRPSAERMKARLLQTGTQKETLCLIMHFSIKWKFCINWTHKNQQTQ